MYCAHCGRQNADEMLFCGYCGKPLVTEDKNPQPDDSESRALYGRPESSAPAKAKDVPIARRASTIVPVREKPQEDDPFALAAETPVRRPVPSPADVVRSTPAEPPRKATPGTEAVQRGRDARTIVPRREVEWDEGNIFLEDSENEAAPTERVQRRAVRRQKNAYEEAERGGFFARHIRGFVSLFLLMMVAVVVTMWAWSPAGERVLAQLNLSRQPAAYARLAEQMNETGSREMEGYYYLRALGLDPDNLDYAICAANAYIASGNNAKATEALVRVVELQPDNVDAYVLLSNLYPVVNTRPEDVRNLIQQGFARTGDSRLQQ